MPAPPIAREVYRAHIEHFGEPAESIVYDDPKVPGPGPARIDVMIWSADERCDMTTFSTIGMCTAPMEGADHRAELHFAVRRHLTAAEQSECALFLANLATYPFHYGNHLDWWHRVNWPGPIPLFPSARAILFHPRFIEKGWDTIETSIAKVKLLNAIPLTEEESLLKPVSAILARWDGRDIFLPW